MGARDTPTVPQQRWRSAVGGLRPARILAAGVQREALPSKTARRLRGRISGQGSDLRRGPWWRYQMARGTHMRRLGRACDELELRGCSNREGVRALVVLLG